VTDFNQNDTDQTSFMYYFQGSLAITKCSHLYMYSEIYFQ